jgi:hypothetical protein
MSSSGPPPEGSAPHEGRAEEGPFAWGESLDLELVGRDDELVRVVALLDAARAQSSGSLVLTGDPGIGKSALLGAAEQLASGFRCLWVRGAESEQVMANAGLLQAISPLRGRLADVPESQAAALSRALGWGSGPGGAERFLVAAATMSLLAAEAEDTRCSSSSTTSSGSITSPLLRSTLRLADCRTTGSASSGRRAIPHRSPISCAAPHGCRSPAFPATRHERW